MGTLTLVGTSLGNYEDISPRALRTIASGDIFLAEDTRVFGKLKSMMLERNAELEFNENQRVLSYREQNHDRVVTQVLELLKQDLTIIQISDAGMPAISDPGYRLVEEVLQHGHEVDVVPSATAIETALVISGLPTDKFIFTGFLPRKSSKIKKVLDEIMPLPYSIVVYESPFRVRKLLELVQDTYGNIQVAACTELTKKFQRVYRGTAETVLEDLPDTLKGEWVIIMNKLK